MTTSIIMKQAHRAERFHFGFCNACERYACGESAEQIQATATKDAVCGSDFERYAVVAGVKAALGAIINGRIDGAMQDAANHGLSQGSRAGLLEMVLSA